MAARQVFAGNFSRDFFFSVGGGALRRTKDMFVDPPDRSLPPPERFPSAGPRSAFRRPGSDRA